MYSTGETALATTREVSGAALARRPSGGLATLPNPRAVAVRPASPSLGC
jgi:hypothetical protein